IFRWQWNHCRSFGIVCPVLLHVEQVHAGLFRKAIDQPAIPGRNYRPAMGIDKKFSEANYRSRFLRYSIVLLQIDWPRWKNVPAQASFLSDLPYRLHTPILFPKPNPLW